MMRSSNTDMWSCRKTLWSWCPKRIWWQKPNGDQLEYSNHAAGYIIWYISRSRIFCYFGVPKRRSKPIQRHLTHSLLTQTHTHIHMHTIHLIYTYKHTWKRRSSWRDSAAAAATAQKVVAAQLLQRLRWRQQQQQKPTHTHTHSYTYFAFLYNIHALTHTYKPL